MKEIFAIFGNAPFQIKDLGEPKKFLGCTFDRDRAAGTIKLSIGHYIDTLVNRLGLTDAKSPGSPLNPGTNLRRRPISEGPDENMIDVPYRATIGCLSWICEACRPDISFARTYLAQFMDNPTMQHWDAAKHVVRYLKGTRDHGIVYRKDVEVGLNIYADADWAGNAEDRKSISGIITLVNGAPLSWESRKQRTVAISTMEAEYNAATCATQDIIWMRRLFKGFSQGFDLGSYISNPTPFYLDNQSAIVFIKNDTSFNRTKHIDTKFKFVRNTMDNKIITIYHVSGTENPADILTKPLAPSVHAKALTLIGVHA
jgi:hypothetical protein